MLNSLSGNSPIVCVEYYSLCPPDFNFFSVNGWPSGFAFILSFLAPLWTIGNPVPILIQHLSIIKSSGAFDASVHISEEASNAATAVPWAIVGATTIAGILGCGMLILIV